MTKFQNDPGIGACHLAPTASGCDFPPEADAPPAQMIGIWDLISELPRLAHRLRKKLKILIARNFVSAEMGKMRRHELRIEQLKILIGQVLNEAHERDFRGVPHPAEHRFAEKGSPERNAIEPAD